jgi:probable HAF family extracellular repeat protein
LGVLPGHYRSEAHGINNKGQIVGWSAIVYRINPDPRAFLCSDGILVDLNQLLPPNCGWMLLKANGINDAGQIVGTGLHNGKRHAFLLSPARR